MFLYLCRPIYQWVSFYRVCLYVQAHLDGVLPRHFVVLLLTDLREVEDLAVGPAPGDLGARVTHHLGFEHSQFTWGGE